MKSDINKKLKERKHELEKLGPSRETKEQQHKFLLELATRFQRVVSLALEAHYGGSPMFKKSITLKLATLVVNRNEIFSRDVSRRGHVLKFNTKTNKEESEHEQMDVDDPAEADVHAPALGDEAALLLSNTKPRSRNRYVGDYEDLEELLHLCIRVIQPKSSDIMAWLEDIYNGSRGFELGTFDCSIVPIIWNEQSAHWDDLALGYISDVICLVHRFHADLLRLCCSDERVVTGIEAALSDHLMQRYWRAISHVRFILYTEREGTPLTANHYFSDNLEKW